MLFFKGLLKLLIPIKTLKTMMSSKKGRLIKIPTILSIITVIFILTAPVSLAFSPFGVLPDAGDKIKIVEQAGIDSISPSQIAQLENEYDGLPKSSTMSIRDSAEYLKKAENGYNRAKKMQTTADVALGGGAGMAGLSSYGMALNAGSLSSGSVSTVTGALNSTLGISGTTVLKASGVATAVAIAGGVTTQYFASRTAKGTVSNLIRSGASLYNSARIASEETGKIMYRLEATGLSNPEIASYIGAKEYAYTYGEYEDKLGGITVEGGLSHDNNAVVLEESPVSIPTKLEKELDLMRKSLNSIKTATDNNSNGVAEDAYLNIVNRAETVFSKVSEVYPDASEKLDKAMVKYDEKIAEVAGDIDNFENRITKYNTKFRLDLVTPQVYSEVNSSLRSLGEGGGEIVVTSLDVSDKAPSTVLNDSEEIVSKSRKEISQAESVLQSQMGRYGYVAFEHLRKVEKNKNALSQKLGSTGVKRNAEDRVSDIKSKIDKIIPKMEDSYYDKKEELHYIVKSQIESKIEEVKDLDNRIEGMVNNDKLGRAYELGADALSKTVVVKKLLSNSPEKLKDLGKNAEKLIEQVENITKKANSDGISPVKEEELIISARDNYQSAVSLIEQGKMKNSSEIISRMKTAESRANQALISLKAKYRDTLNKLENIRDKTFSSVSALEYGLESAKSLDMEIPKDVEEKIESISQNLDDIDDKYYKEGKFSLSKVAGKVNSIKKDYNDIQSAVKSITSENPWVVNTSVDYNITTSFPQGIEGSSYTKVKMTIEARNTISSRISEFPVIFNLPGTVKEGSIVAIGLRDYSVLSYDNNRMRVEFPYLAPSGENKSKRKATINFDARVANVIKKDVKQSLDNVSTEYPVLFKKDITVRSYADFPSFEINVDLDTTSLDTDSVVVVGENGSEYDASVNVKDTKTKVSINLPDIEENENMDMSIRFAEPSPKVKTTETSSVKITENDKVYTKLIEKVSVKNRAMYDIENLVIQYLIPKGIDRGSVNFKLLSDMVAPSLQVEKTTIGEEGEDTMVVNGFIDEFTGGTEASYEITYKTYNLPATANYLQDHMSDEVESTENIIDMLEEQNFDMSQEKNTLKMLKSSLSSASDSIDNGNYKSAVDTFRSMKETIDPLVDKLYDIKKTYQRTKADIDKAEVMLEELLGYAESLKGKSNYNDVSNMVSSLESSINSRISQAKSHIEKAELEPAKDDIDSALDSIKETKGRVDNIVRDRIDSKLNNLGNRIDNLVSTKTTLESMGVKYLSGLETKLEQARSEKQAINDYIDSREYLKALSEVSVAENYLNEAESIVDKNMTTIARDIYLNYLDLTNRITEYSSKYKNRLDNLSLAVKQTYDPSSSVKTPYTESVTNTFERSWNSSYDGLKERAESSRGYVKNYYQDDMYQQMLSEVHSKNKNFQNQKVELKSDISEMKDIISTIRSLAKQKMSNADGKLTSVQQEISALKEEGNDVSSEETKVEQAEDYMDRARNYFKKGEYTNAMAYSKEVGTIVDEVKNTLGYVNEETDDGGHKGLIVGITATLIIVIVVIVILIKRYKEKEKSVDEEDEALGPIFEK